MTRPAPDVAARLCAAVLLVLALFLGAAVPAVAQAPKRTPLLIDGKQTLYQRVLTRPGAVAAGEPGRTDGKALPPLSVLFVYKRADVGERIYLEVGAGSDGRTIGWVDAQNTIPWRHTMVMAFTNPANRDRVLFLRNRTDLMDLLQSDQLLAKAEAWRRAVAAGTLPPDSPVVSIEPETFVDLQKQFYLLPILEATSTLLPSGFKVRTVEVASVTRDVDVTPTAPAQRVNPAPADFRSAVVFVIDASSSMQPYIDSTRAAVEAVYREIETAKLADKVRFGLVAYRDDPAKTAGIEYLARVFADPTKISSRQAFMDSVGDLSASRVSTRAFAEDGYAGLDAAVRSIDWSGFGGRYVILVTDASSREGGSPLASTGLSTDAMHQLVQENGIALYTMHLKTPEGAADHAAAKAQYERLSRFQGVGSLYFPVEAGDPAAFKAQVQRLAGMLVRQVKEAETRAAGPAAPPPETAKDKLAEATEAVGLAMRLAWLGSVQGTTAPRMFQAWASDRDYRKPDVATFSVRVLLTRNQLSDLQTTLRRVVEAGERGQIAPDDFFNQLRSAAVAMGRDPSRIAQGDVRNLEAVGLMGEYLDGLPYQSNVMSIDPDGWTRMGVGEQQAIIDDVKAKMALYQRFHDDADRWVKLHPEAAPGDAVYPVPIDSLP